MTMQTTTDILQAMISGDGHIEVLRGPTGKYITVCRADGSAMFAGDLPPAVLDDLLKASFVSQDGPENAKKITIFRLTDDGKARGR
jgi:hypothetical protein